MSTQVSFTKKIEGFDFSMASILSLARRRRYFTVAVISWLVILVLAGAVLVPAVQSILDIRQELSTASDELRAKQDLISGLESLDTSVLSRNNQILAAALPVEKPVLPVLFSIDRLATDANVSLSNFQVSPGLLGTASGKLDAQVGLTSLISPQLATLPLKMIVSGGFANLSTFFQSLDNVVPFIQINAIQFTTDELQSKASASAVYSAEVSLSSLYLKNSFGPGTVTVVAPLTSKENTLLDRLTIANDERIKDAASMAPATSASSSGLIFTTASP